MFRSLKTEMLVFTLGLATIVIVITTAISVFSTRIAGNNAAEATSGALRDQAENYLSQIAMTAAQQQDAVFERMKNDTSVAATYVSAFYDQPSLFPRDAYWRLDTHVWLEKGRYLNAASDASTVHIPSFVVLDDAEKARIERTARLDFIVPGILRNYPDTVAMYAIDAQGVTRYYPNIVLGSLAPPDYDPRADVFYKPATPAEDPERKIVWSPVYDDVVGRGLMITVIAPVYAKSGFAGIVASDILLSNIIKTIMTYSPIEGSYAFLIDKDGYTVAFPDIAYADIAGRPRAAGEARMNLGSSTPAFLPILAEMKSGEQGFASFRAGQRDLLIAYAPLRQTGFSIAIVAERDVTLRAATALHGEIEHSIRNMIFLRILPASLLIIVIASAASILLVTRIVEPVQALTEGAREIGRGNLDYEIKVESGNEIGELASSFRQMSRDLKRSRQELEEYSRGLEEKVRERTAQLAGMNRHQESLMHFIGHEVKGYLTKAQGGFADIAEGDYDKDLDTLKGFARNVLSEMRRGVATVADILDASNMKRGTLAYMKQSFDVRATVGKVVEELRHEAEAKNLALEISLEDEPLMLVGDEGKIAHHVVRNLIDNAIRYTPQGKVRIELARTETGLRFSVEDGGVGIAPADMPILFTEGGRGTDSVKYNPDSTGYGLFIAKQVVEAHGGTITAQSEGQGKGARFVVELPFFGRSGASA